MNIKLKTNSDESRLEFTEIERYADGSGFGGKLYVLSSGFSGNVFCSFETHRMNDFIQNLEACNKTLLGEAELKSDNDYWFIKFSMGPTGRVGVEGLIHNFDHELEFDFGTDQTCLASFIGSLKEWARLESN